MFHERQAVVTRRHRHRHVQAEQHIAHTREWTPSSGEGSSNGFMEVSSDDGTRTPTDLVTSTYYLCTDVRALSSCYMYWTRTTILH